ncbi:MAG: DUF4132 domain-containing protein [Polyangiales bacterium]
MIDWASCEEHIHHGRGTLAPWPEEPKKAPTAAKVWSDSKKAFEKARAGLADITLDEAATAALARLDARLALTGKAATQCEVDAESQGLAFAICAQPAFHTGTTRPPTVKIVRDWVQQFGLEFAVQALIARWSWSIKAGPDGTTTIAHGACELSPVNNSRHACVNKHGIRELRFLFGQSSAEEYDKGVAAVRAEWEKPIPPALRACLAYLVPTEQDLALAPELDEIADEDVGWLGFVAWSRRDPEANLRVHRPRNRNHTFAFLCSGPGEALAKALQNSPKFLYLPEVAYLGHPVVADFYTRIHPSRRDPYFHRFPKLALETLPGDDPLRAAVLRANPSLNPNAAATASDEEVPALLRTDGRSRKALPRLWTHHADLFLLGADKALSSQHVERLGRALMRSKGRMTPELQEVRDALEPRSRDAFGLALYEAYSAARGESWIFRSLCVLSDDAVVDRLAADVIKMGYQKAVVALEVLASVGSERAMLRIAHVAAKGRGRGVKNTASSWLTRIARARGLSKDQLADRLVPDLGLDGDGSLVFDLGHRSFRVGFDEQLKPWVQGEDGKKRASLPKSKKDDAEKAALAKTRWSALKKSARMLASVQIARFEQAMLRGREWSMDEFQQYLVTHPLLRHLVRRLVWRSGDLVFRIDESGQPVDALDNEQALGTEPVRLVHPLEMNAETLQSWGVQLADYELLQPFDQLQRETFAFGSVEANAVIERIEGARAKGGSVAGLQNHGWSRGPVEDAGQWYSLQYRAKDLKIELMMDHGVNIQGGYGMDQEQKLSIKIEALPTCTPQAYSEALRSLARLALLE